MFPVDHESSPLIGGHHEGTYMYAQDDKVLREDASFKPVGRKGRVRAAMASLVFQEMARGEIPVVIGRAPKFYGPGRTQSITNSLVIDRLKSGKTPRVPVRDDRCRTLIWTPGASRALAALSNAHDAFGQTWHLPCDDNRLTYRQLVELAADVFGGPPSYKVLPKWMLMAASLVSDQVRELRELLPRYERDHLFDSTKFKQRFPEFQITTYRKGLELIRDERAPRR